MAPTSYPQDIDARRLVNVGAERATNVSSTDFPGHYPGEDHRWSLAQFKENSRVEVTRLSNRSIEFDMVGVDASIANAYRRVMIAEVPTVCIEHVYMWNNTSVMQDEVLAHRLGLIPLNVDPDLFQMRNSENDVPTDQNTLVFKLNVSCERKAKEGTSKDLDVLYSNHTVTAGMLEWVPQGEQAELEVFKNNPPAPTNPNIVLIKLRPGQSIDFECHAVKNVGKEHAKWSPVATASYRLHPYIQLLSQPPRHLTQKFQACFSPGVIRVNTRTGKAEVDEKKVRNESMSREIFRHPDLEGCVKLGRIRDWFLFKVESEGPYAPEDLVPAAGRILKQKIAVLRKAAEALKNQDSEEPTKDGLESADTGADGDVVMMES